MNETLTDRCFFREIIGGDNSMTAGYRWGHVTSVHGKYIYALGSLGSVAPPAFISSCCAMALVSVLVCRRWGVEGRSGRVEGREQAVVSPRGRDCRARKSFPQRERERERIDGVLFWLSSLSLNSHVRDGRSVCVCAYKPQLK